MHAILRYARWLYGHSAGIRWKLGFNVLLGVLGVGLNLAFIFACKRLVDIATGVLAGDLVLAAVLAGGLLLLRILVSGYNAWLQSIVSSKMNFIIRSRIYAEVMQARWAGREKMHTGDMMNRLESDVTAVTGVICNDLPEMVTTLSSSRRRRFSSR